MTDDLIRRQDAIDALGEEPKVLSMHDEYELGLRNQWHDDVYALKAVPPVPTESDSEWRRKHYEESYNQGFVDGCKLYERQPERKRGKWKHGYCSECGYNWGKDAPIASVPNYCPSCGSYNGEDGE